MNLPNEREVLAQLPPNYLVLNLFQNSVMDSHFWVLGKNLTKKDWYAIFSFDGINNVPISCETFWQNKEMLEALNKAMR